MKKLFSEGAHFSLLYRKHVKFAGFNFILFSNSILTAEHIQIGTSKILSQCILILKAEMFSSVQFSCSVMSDSLRPHESQHTRPPCPSPTQGVYSNSCPLSQ